jgi:malonyl CoA-acyl carrier protein transacylase
MECMRDEDPERWLERGPGSVLTGLLRRIDRSLSATSVGDAKDVDALLTGA